MDKQALSVADGTARRRAFPDLVKAKNETLRLASDLHIAIYGGAAERARAKGRIIARLDLIVEHVADAQCEETGND